MKLLSAAWMFAFAFVGTAPLVAQRADAPEEVERLEESRWFTRVSDELERGEYRFCSAPDAPQTWSAPNRAHGFRSRISPAGLEVVPRVANEKQWKLLLSTESFGRVQNPLELDTTAVRVSDGRAELDHGPLTEWFVNDERGLEQGWTIANAPAGSEKLWIGLDVRGDLSLRIDASGRSGVFVDASGEARLRYVGLQVLDAAGRELDARLSPSPHGIGISIDDVGARYPLTVDPVLTGPAWTAEGGQADSRFARCVASAGDVNADGYSDVIVGAQDYDNGQSSEGRAFLYLGSSSGLSSSANWTAEGNQTAAIFGRCVATAGDVNGDGYSDVIVGAHGFDNGQTDEGRAFVYLGSAAGLSSSVAWSAESDHADAFFGWSVSTAGDVNGDGYSDVVVGAHRFDLEDINGNNGHAYVFLGSSTGLAASPAWTAVPDDLVGNEWFGYSAAAAGDVNGDGYGDVIVGAHMQDYFTQTDRGKVYLYLGSASGLSRNADWTVLGVDGFFGMHGWSVATAGDVNGDGYGDVIVGGPGVSNSQYIEGGAFVYLGSSAGLSTSAAWTVESNQVQAWFGTSVASAGDVNGDGYSDVLVGAYAYDNGQTDEGRAYLYLGSSAGVSTTASWTAESDQAVADFGLSVAGAGDVNGDGYSDVIVGAYGYDNDQMNEGRAYVYMGSAEGLSANAAATAESDQVGAQIGSAVATAGDVNGDGYSDVIVGAYRYDNGQTDEGRAFVYLGSSFGIATNAAWTAESNQVDANFGWSVATAGDVNGDGFSDVIVGAYAYDNGEVNEGRAYLYLGSSTGLSAGTAWIAEGNQADATFGWSVASAGDVNGDGYGDVIVGAPEYDNSQIDEGRVLIYLGSSLGLSPSPVWTAQSGQAGARFGSSVASAGDVNRDELSDVIVGARHYDNGQTDEGRAFVFLGSGTGISTSVGWTTESDQVNAQLGVSVASAGDVNGDRYSDVIVGAYTYDNGQTNEGRAFVYHGSATGLLIAPVWTAEGDNATAFFGWSVASAGDVNGDGYSDVIVGAPDFSGGDSLEGRAFVYLGSSSGLATSAAWTAESNQFEAFFGWSAASAGDVNGDGYSDVVVGSYSYDNGQTDEGRTFVYLGNEARGGWTLGPQQRRANDVAPIHLLGRTANKHEFRIKLGFETALAGFAWASGLTPKARLEWEVRQLHAPFDGSRIESGAEQTVTGLPLVFNELALFESGGFSPAHGIIHPAATGAYAQQLAAGAYRWRARVRTNNPLFPVTPWTTIPWNNVTETKLRAAPLPAQYAPH